jgi:hypothetical protein
MDAEEPDVQEALLRRMMTRVQLVMLRMAKSRRLELLEPHQDTKVVREVDAEEEEASAPKLLDLKMALKGRLLPQLLLQLLPRIHSSAKAHKVETRKESHSEEMVREMVETVEDKEVERDLDEEVLVAQLVEMLLLLATPSQLRNELQGWNETDGLF